MPFKSYIHKQIWFVKTGQISVMVASLPFFMGAQLRGFTSHGSGLQLGAGWQKWKLLDVSGTQPLIYFSDAVVLLKNTTECTKPGL